MDKNRNTLELQPEIVVIGASIIDTLVCPAEPDVFDTGSFAAESISMSPGADALNEATILAKMGRKVRLETVIGDDEAGRYLLEHCARCGIELPKDAVRGEYVTGINVVLVRGDGSRSFLTNANGTLRKLGLSDIHMPFPESAGIISFASIFVFPHIGPEELKIIFSQAKSQGKIVCADMTKCKNGETVKELRPALQYIDYLIPNDEEAMLFTGKETVEDAAEELALAGVSHVVIKAGGRGCYVKDSRHCLWIPAKKGVRCLDTTGAGDSFAAGFIYALSEGRDLIACAEYANHCGARAIQVIGATKWL